MPRPNLAVQLTSRILDYIRANDLQPDQHLPSQTLADALRVKPALLGFPGHAHVELSDERAVYHSSFSNFCIDIGMLRTARWESTL